MRVRITFSKTESMRFTSHLDLYKTWERTIRRSKLNLTYSQGFKPHPRINIGAALPLGYTCEQDLMDIWLGESLPENQIVEMLQPCLPPGLITRSIEQVDPNEPVLQKIIHSAKFEVKIFYDLPDLEDKIQKLLNSNKIIRVRRGKEYDLRPLIIDISLLTNTKDRNTTITMTLLCKEGATGRPEEVIEELSKEVKILSILRKKLLLQTTGQVA